MQYCGYIQLCGVVMRKFIHVDLDAFYASVELLDKPELRDKPVAVGGNKERRGVLTTCNYIARQFGVRSAMATQLAIKKCPNLVVLPVRMSLYKEYSQVITRFLSNILR